MFKELTATELKTLDARLWRGAKRARTVYFTESNHVCDWVRAGRRMWDELTAVSDDSADAADAA